MNHVIYQSQNVVISQQTPQPRTIWVGYKSYFIHFPCLVFVSCSKQDYPYSYVFASYELLTSYYDEVAVVPFPNIRVNGQICLSKGEMGYFVYNIKKDIYEYHEWSRNAFFANPFLIGEISSYFWQSEEAESWRKAKHYKDVKLGYQKSFLSWMEFTPVIDEITE